MKFPHTPFRAIAVALVLGLLTALPAAADDDKWIFRIDAAAIDAEAASGSVPGRFAAGFDVGTGLSVAVEYRINPRLGVEGGVIAAHTARGIAVVFGPWSASLSLRSFVPLTAALNLHLTPDKPVDLYLGPLLAYSIFTDDAVLGWPFAGGSGLRSIDNDPGWGLQAGIDVPFGERRWGFHSSLKYLDVTRRLADPIGRDRVEVDLDPLIVSVGLHFKF